MLICRARKLGINWWWKALQGDSMTLHLTPQLELALVSEAARRGITPEALAAELITAQLPSMAEQDPPRPEATSSAEESPPGTMYDRWKAHLESLPKPPPGAPPTNY